MDLADVAQLISILFILILNIGIEEKKEVNALTVDKNGHVPVKIHLKTNIRQSDESETFELVLFGHYYRKNGADFLIYDEVQEEGTVHTIVKMKDNEVLILRSGILKMRLKFHLDKEGNGSYESRYGTFFLGTKTNTFKHETSTTADDTLQGNVQLIYTLLMQGTSVGTYDMEIHYRESEEQLLDESI